MRVLISGGGTGGHLFPAIAVAQALFRKDPDAEVLYVGRRGGLEEAVVPRYGIRFATIAAPKLDREALWNNWRLPVAAPRALWQAWLLVRRFRPDVVLGTGGYVSAPLILVAAGLRVPIVLQEQNFIPGRTTRLLSRFARTVATAYAGSEAYLDGRPVVLTGTPVRPDFQVRRPAFPALPGRILILGGSQGARRINQAVAQALPDLLARTGIVIVHQTGPRDLPEMERVKESLPAQDRDRYQPFAFTDDLPARLYASDLLVSRAGASTLSEASAVGVPLVLIPGPFAGGHQVYNARPLAEAGAAVIIPNEQCDGPRLTQELAAIVTDPARYGRMIAAMRAQARPQAAADVVGLLEQAVRRT